ncbi:hypothetical protein BJX76DRAFT_339352 [Aspergillus varians]
MSRVIFWELVFDNIIRGLSKCYSIVATEDPPMVDSLAWGVLSVFLSLIESSIFFSTHLRIRTRVERSPSASHGTSDKARRS